jgi:mersacidin/lichenicidin family type 2 lantibiotic
MKKFDLVRLWKDPEYRARLEAEGVELPASPMGAVELSDEQLTQASGMVSGGVVLTTAITCTELSWRGWRACCP